MERERKRERERSGTGRERSVPVGNGTGTVGNGTERHGKGMEWERNGKRCGNEKISDLINVNFSMKTKFHFDAKELLQITHLILEIYSSNFLK